MKSLPKLCVAMLVCLVNSAALAHAGLAQTVPAHDAVLAQAPAELHFQFMAQVTISNIRLEITGGDRKGERVEVRLPRNSIGQSTAFGEQIALALPSLAPASYRVTYQAVSIDGHIMVDDFSFTVSAN
jgi:methionine-rich copper-binding protein CopC